MHYVEGLIRGPQGTRMEAPDALFALARRSKRTGALDRACLSAILESAAVNLPAGALTAINVHASTLALDDDFPAFLSREARRTGIALGSLVLEIVEHDPASDIARFREALGALRALGLRIALDDVGLGHSNYLMILECRPDYFKIDRYFVTGSHSDFYRRAVLKSVAQLALAVGARVVAEGVETGADLAVVRSVGIDLAQGWLFGKPVAAADTGSWLRPTRSAAA